MGETGCYLALIGQWGFYRYTVSGDQEILYDHDNDPTEMKNVALDLPEITAKFRKAVKYWYNNSDPINPPKTY